jgi:hypothetical protein
LPADEIGSVIFNKKLDIAHEFPCQKPRETVIMMPPGAA